MIVGVAEPCPIQSSHSGTTLVSRHFKPRNTVSGVTYTTMNRPDLTFTVLEA